MAVASAAAAEPPPPSRPSRAGDRPVSSAAAALNAALRAVRRARERAPPHTHANRLVLQTAITWPRQVSHVFSPDVTPHFPECSSQLLFSFDEQADVRDVAASESKPNSVAGAICNIVRESPSGEPPAVMATGPAAINQAAKAIAIARKYLLEESPPVDLLVTPRFEQDLRAGSNLVLELKRSETIEREPADNDLSVKERTEAHKLAGAIAGRVRDGDEVAVTTKGAVPVLVAIKAVALAQEYLQEDGVHMSFAVQFRDLEDPELRNTPSTFLHFAIVYSAAE